MSKGFIWTIKDKVEVNEGEILSFAGRWDWLTSNVASADMEVYLGAEDVTSSVTTGSITINGKTVTYKKIQNLVGGKTYRVRWHATDAGGQVHIRMTEMKVIAKKTGK